MQGGGGGSAAPSPAPTPLRARAAQPPGARGSGHVRHQLTWLLASLKSRHWRGPILWSCPSALSWRPVTGKFNSDEQFNLVASFLLQNMLP